MCLPSLGGAADYAGFGGLLENFGDPLGTRKRREESQQNRWAREDQIRNATFAHEQSMADKQYGSNRSQLGTGRVGRAPGSGTGTPTSSRGGGRSQSSNTNRAY
jgi:hypothetical protein